MKKILIFFALCASVIACTGNSTNEVTVTDSTTVDSVVVDTAIVDTIITPAV